MPARPGAFTANFAPETLNKFRETCKRSGLQYTKVLEELADLYLQSNGLVLQYMAMQEAFASKSEVHKKTIQKIFEYLDTKELLDVETKKELTSITISNLVQTGNLPTERQRHRDHLRLERMSDPTIDRASPPEELTKWEEGYSDIFEKVKVIERKIWDKLRDTDHKYSTAVTGLKKQVSALEDQLSKLQSEVSD